MSLGQDSRCWMRPSTTRAKDSSAFSFSLVPARASHLLVNFCMEQIRPSWTPFALLQGGCYGTRHHQRTQGGHFACDDLGRQARLTSVPDWVLQYSVGFHAPCTLKELEKNKEEHILYIAPRKPKTPFYAAARTTILPLTSPSAIVHCFTKQLV